MMNKAVPKIEKELDRAERFLTTSDLARLFKVTPDEVGYWARKGKIPAFKKGKQWRFLKSEIKKWARKNFS